ncbi:MULTISPECIES: ABC transporter substrate-binding protein [unclassified Paenibacillus]|uniref:ABC transporter substrate-binding protein n=1 Tax=unclassified Paenibacillus TaxID=185978 RepID=UPI002404D8BE|nr:MULTISPECIES: ABC transporter substrate-binding protein [unclassified Paenibacillus]MDF9842121.1 iron complex transport system substrate-binding protein [Paenibacillus sp. PastF-2]MDF9848625.1 iron complex transport system substrate-binding protein [Paenibacillus sp. PastM-2]MDF9855194.1 iron complex transport system substrate-binding protein [Paenibacillus sp. PastF-1]MDH6480464.1 iron complex transport system substrate-binding protein [Paenibacillus sp. PastH-2]MDH6507892.1 iron complex t
MLKKAKQPLAVLCVIFLMSALLLACGNNNGQTETGNAANTASNTAASAAPSPEASGTAATAETQTYTDYKGHTVEIPVTPERIIYSGETYGDLAALGVKAVGYPLSMGEGQIFEDQLAGVEEVGFPINLEKTLELQPDLIIYAGTDEADFEALFKIAPTVIFNTFAPLEERMTELGVLLGKKQEAESWLAQYKTSETAMWEQLKAAGMKEGETASVFTYYPGDRLFVMAATGLSQVLYGEGGFKAPAPIQTLLDEGTGFLEISMEVISQYAGDRIFILTPVADEAKQSTDAMIRSEIWKSLPAVKNGYVYTQDIMKTSADASTREWLLTELPRLMGGN